MNREKILVVDDEPCIRETFDDLLSGEFKIQSVENREEAIEKIKDQSLRQFDWGE